MTILDMKSIRYLNLFEKITKVRVKNCFFYNNFIIFAIPSYYLAKAIGEEGRNVREISRILNKKVKIVALPETISGTEKFISAIVSPITFRGLQVNPGEIIITANMQSKASLIGRNKTRLLELKKIVEEFFGKKLRIV